MPRDYFKRGFLLFHRGQFIVSAQAIAFKVLITWVPIAILGVGVLGSLLSKNRPYQIIQNYLTSYFPTWQAERLFEFADEMQRISGTLTVVGLIAVVWSAVSLFSTLRVAVSNVFREDWHRVRKWTHGLAFDVRMTFFLGVLFVATAVLTIGAQLLDDQGIELMQRVGIEADWLLSGWRDVAHIIALFVPLLLGFGMFFQLYYFVPLPHPPRNGVVLGAFVAAVLWEIGKYFFTSYATGYGRYDNWVMTVQSDRIGMLGDIFGLIVAFVLWAYYSGVVLMVGGAVVLVHEMRRRERTSGISASATT